MSRIKVVCRRATVFMVENVPGIGNGPMAEYVRRALDFLDYRSLRDVPDDLKLGEHLYRDYPMFSDERLEKLADEYRADYAIVTKKQLRGRPSLYEFEDWRVVRMKDDAKRER